MTVTYRRRRSGTPLHSEIVRTPRSWRASARSAPCAYGPWSTTRRPSAGHRSPRACLCRAKSTSVRRLVIGYGRPPRRSSTRTSSGLSVRSSDPIRPSVASRSMTSGKSDSTPRRSGPGATASVWRSSCPGTSSNWYLRARPPTSSSAARRLWPPGKRVTARP